MKKFLYVAMLAVLPLTAMAQHGDEVAQLFKFGSQSGDAVRFLYFQTLQTREAERDIQ